METFYSCVIVIVICIKNWQITITFVSSNYTEFEKTQKSKTIVAPTMLPITTPGACQVLSTITHTVARQAHTEWRQRTMFIHDVRITHESARMLAMWENHNTLVWSKIAVVTKFRCSYVTAW